MESLPPGDDAWYAAIGEALLATGRLADNEGLEALVEQLSAAGWDPRPSAARLAAFARAGFSAFIAGRADAARALISRTRDVEPSALAADPAAQARIHQARALEALSAADPAAYLTEMEASLHAFLEAGDLRSACSQRTNTGFAYVSIGAPARGAVELREALPQAEAMGLHTVAAMIRANLGLALTHVGALYEARRELEAAVAVFAAQSDARLLGGARIYLAELLLRAGEVAAAREEAGRAVESLGAHPPARAYALGMLARALLDGGETAAALARAEEASALLDELGGIEDGEALVRLVHAEALRAAGRMDEARERIAAAAARLRERAARIADDAWRVSFLDGVREHRRTLELAVAWGRG